MKKSLLTLPFDQYSRQYFVSEMIDAIKTVTKKPKVSILDIGGYKGKTTEFQPADKVTIADLFDVDEPNYVKVPADSLPFDDGVFDIAVSFDAYEHVPRKNREQFLLEALRVSDGFFVMAAPFDNPHGDTHKAEVIANDIYREMSGQDHRWLKEHIEYRIPENKEIEELCHNNGIHFFAMPTNDIAIWLMLQAVFFTAEIKTNPFAMVEKINRLYNSNLELFESDVRQEGSYRTVYCMSRDKSAIKKAQNVFEKNRLTKRGSHTESKLDVTLQLQHLVNQAYLLLAKD